MYFKSVALVVASLLVIPISATAEPWNPSNSSHDLDLQRLHDRQMARLRPGYVSDNTYYSPVVVIPAPRVRIARSSQR